MSSAIAPQPSRRPAAPGLAPGTPVLTLDGALPVQFLVPGDRVITRSGVRDLKRIDIARRHAAEVVRFDPAALGSADGCAGACLGAAQPVHLRDWRARALCGRATGSVEAGRLVDGEILRRERLDEAQLFVLRFEQEEVIYAGGLELTCAPAA